MAKNGWGYHYDVVNNNESGRKKWLQPFSLYDCAFLTMVAIGDVNLLLIRRLIFQSMSSLNVRERNFMHTQKIIQIQSDGNEAEDDETRIHSFAIECSLI